MDAISTKKKPVVSLIFSISSLASAGFFILSLLSNIVSQLSLWLHYQQYSYSVFWFDARWEALLPALISLMLFFFIKKGHKEKHTHHLVAIIYFFTASTFSDVMQFSNGIKALFILSFPCIFSFVYALVLLILIAVKNDKKAAYIVYGALNLLSVIPLLLLYFGSANYSFSFDYIWILLFSLFDIVSILLLALGYTLFIASVVGMGFSYRKLPIKADITAKATDKKESCPALSLSTEAEQTEA